MVEAFPHHEKWRFKKKMRTISKLTRQRNINYDLKLGTWNVRSSECFGSWLEESRLRGCYWESAVAQIWWTWNHGVGSRRQHIKTLVQCAFFFHFWGPKRAVLAWNSQSNIRMNLRWNYWKNNKGTVIENLRKKMYTIWILIYLLVFRTEISKVRRQ